MASIRRRPDRGEGVWQVTVSAGKDPATGRYRQLTRTIDAGPPTAKGDPPRKVKELVGVLEAEVRAGTASGKDTTLKFALDAYIARCRRLGRARRTVGDYEGMRDRLVEDGIARLTIGKLTAAELGDFDARLVAAGLSTTRRAHYFDLLSQTLNMAVDLEWVERNPVRKMKSQRTVPTIQLGQVHPPTMDEVGRLIAAAQERKDPDLAALIYVAASTGARRGELAGLTVGAVDGVRNRLTIRQVVEDTRDGVRVRPGTKTGKVRVVAFGDDTAAVLADQYQRVKQRCTAARVDVTPDRYLWSQELDHSLPWRPDRITHTFDRLRDRCGLPHVHLHALRHLAVTRALEAGVDVKTAASRFGHDPTLMLRRYAHALPTSDQVAAAAGERGLVYGNDESAPTGAGALSLGLDCQGGDGG